MDTSPKIAEKKEEIIEEAEEMTVEIMTDSIEEEEEEEIEEETEAIVNLCYLLRIAIKYFGLFFAQEFFISFDPSL